MAASYTRPQSYVRIRSSIRDDDDEALNLELGNGSSTGTGNEQGIKKLHGQVQEVVGVMKKNIDKLLDRDVGLSNLMTRADELHTTADTYNQTTKQLSRKIWWKNAKTNICIGTTVAIVLIIIIVSIVVNRRKK
ncbi:unnamed protein product [Didymodactylos carnosus]|uniref:V-SNARE coiled-coil homology domain-containing protein n=1 Tax=Didymodactylos carnosus TaxID=1234261 RepID=A0A813VSN9_9BILA|nr:unnamed protein product [Didymodactylos carnosus]CAF3633491.1 unnamed protein product [Didymodactylos carnosus]